MIFSCKNDMKTIATFNIDENTPAETAREFEMLYSDSGRVLIKLQAESLRRFADDNPYIEFPEGIKLYFFDSLMNVKAALSAEYGISWEKTKIMEVKTNVVVNDFEKDETINTEHLIWDQNDRKIYSDVFVKRTGPDGVIYGDGFDADERFRSFTLRNPKGVFTINENKSPGK
ncbi:MAG: LPS export ABC transporter periplasmic protein LptC [Sphingobacteriia bacterium]|nr:LPS export ABC transporter periplasmic protein LptC [Sphingobacteriia bacterium]